ncbi:hypothetical protein Kpol_358p2 [Vanderwaltozyma polyspora DSM 70294]|uniref:Uncharacterized protein n=1 Tax=Vanderwaltozyma polyspora (strain ATCC 22028 / DSM 70294 / BCRC 21397 / CBS 2163 / NBRC 10782 / NRRL Y-8283 / UCD 57-17) TaxID=436907 RepID=A7TSG9_VANPO|nr:uncharacterized protein Kpol_358p2 [Vanderwaltozyma polyspora DSM 70294]EDO14785.1 hypothetical protein Kpol_358p2 [Vanderwaltozyma polyspora DSM 70294]
MAIDQDYLDTWGQVTLHNYKNFHLTFDTFNTEIHYQLYSQLFPFDYEFMQMRPISSLEMGFAYLFNSVESYLIKYKLDYLLFNNKNLVLISEITPLHEVEENFIKQHILKNYFYSLIENFDSLSVSEIWNSLLKILNDSNYLRKMALKSFNRLDFTKTLLTLQQMDNWVLETDSWYSRIKNSKFNKSFYKWKIINSFKYTFGQYFSSVVLRWEEETVSLEEIFNDILTIQTTDKELFV